MLLSVGIGVRSPKLRLLAGFRPDRRGDVAAHLGERAAVCGGKRVVAVTLRSLLRDRAARARRCTHGLVYGPYRVEQRPLAPRRLETLDVNRDRVGRTEGRHR